MDANLILDLVPQRVAQRNADGYEADYLHVVLRPDQSRSFKAQNQILFIVGEAPEGIRVQSDYGQYDLDNFNAEIQQHEHSGNVTVTNDTNDQLSIHLYRIILKRTDD